MSIALSVQISKFLKEIATTSGEKEAIRALLEAASTASVNLKQNTLDGSNLKTVAGQTLLGSGDVTLVNMGAAPITSPNFGGAPTTTTPALGNNSALIANTTFVRGENTAMDGAGGEAPNGSPVGLISADLGSGNTFASLPSTGIPLVETTISGAVVYWSSDRHTLPPASGTWFSVSSVFDGDGIATNWRISHYVDGVLSGTAYDSVDVTEYPEAADYEGSGLVTISRSSPVAAVQANYLGQWRRIPTSDPVVFNWWQWNGYIWILRFTD